MHIGLLFGSFNPIHTGHVLIAQKMRELNAWDMVWFVLSPQNPFKEHDTLLSAEYRWLLLNTALRDEVYLDACDIELSMPQPSYTVDTMKLLGQKYPDCSFHIIIGGDNVASLNKWKEIDSLLTHFDFHVYTRTTAVENQFTHKHIIEHEMPLFDISATDIRARIQSKQSLSGLVHPGVAALIAQYGLYS